MSSELEEKLGRIRRLLQQKQMDAVFLSRPGNLAWLMCGGDPVVSMMNTPVVRALVTREEARLLVLEYERDRIESEEMPEGMGIVYLPWFDPQAFDQARLAMADPERTLCDEPLPGAVLHDFWQLRVPLLPAEMERYQALGRDAAAAVGDVMRNLQPGRSEHEIAGDVAGVLRRRGMQPAVLLVGGDTRLKRFRHPVPSAQPVNDRVLVVVCARRHGLFANLSRMAAFTPLGPQEGRRYHGLLEIEASALAATRHGRFVRDVLGTLQQAYAAHRQPLAWTYHHQGGPTGYFTRDYLATPSEDRIVMEGSAYAWNPSLPGLKVEDTVLLARQELTVLTRDPQWPMVEVEGMERPEVLLLG